MRNSDKLIVVFYEIVRCESTWWEMKVREKCFVYWFLIKIDWMLNRNKLDWAAGYNRSLPLRMAFLWVDHLGEKQTNHFSFDQKLNIFFRSLNFSSECFLLVWLVVTCGAHHCSSVCGQQQFVRFFVFSFTSTGDFLKILPTFERMNTKLRKESVKCIETDKTMHWTMPSALLLYICHHVNGENFECGVGFLQQQRKTHVCSERKEKLPLFFFDLKYTFVWTRFFKLGANIFKAIRFLLRLGVLLCKHDRNRHLGEFNEIIESLDWLYIALGFDVNF